MSLFLAVTSLLLTIVWLPESFRYLYGKKQFADARDVLDLAATINKSGFDFKAAKFEAEVIV